MLRITTLALAALPLAAVALAPQAPALAQAAKPIDQVATTLRAVSTMTANFAQTDRRGRTLNGRLTLKRPGRIRFEYQPGVKMLIVADGRRLNMVDYEVKRVESWPIANSPLSVLLNPNQDISRMATVVRNDRQVVLVRARDPKRPEFGTITIAFARIASAPGGLMLQGWTTIDAQNNRTTVKLSNQRFNVAVADSAFAWTDPRRAKPRG
ncbi:MAG TPA: outer membrane lipoprotein carrier protein LolA [Allosphingosinicella sp.]